MVRDESAMGFMSGGMVADSVSEFLQLLPEIAAANKIIAEAPAKKAAILDQYSK